MRILREEKMDDGLLCMTRELLWLAGEMKDLQALAGPLEAAIHDRFKEQYGMDNDGSHRIDYNPIQGTVRWIDLEDGVNDDEQAIFDPSVGRIRAYVVEYRGEVWQIGEDGNFTQITDLEELRQVREAGLVLGISSIGIYNFTGKWLTPILERAINYEKQRRQN